MNNKTSSKQFFQILLPFTIITIILGFYTFFLVNNSFNEEFTLRFLGNIAAVILLFLILPSGILSLALVIALIALNYQSSMWISDFFPKIISIVKKVNQIILSVSKHISEPFITIESIGAAIERKKKR